jgi:hypothetical protein
MAKKISGTTRPKRPKARPPNSKLMRIGQTLSPATKNTKAKTGMTSQYKPSQARGAGI